MIRLCLAESSSLMSPTFLDSDSFRCAHHGSMPINKAVNAARVDWPEIIRAL